MAKSIYGLVSNQKQADSIISNLLAAGIPNKEISYLFPDKNTKWENEKLTKVEYKPWAANGKNGRSETQMNTENAHGHVHNEEKLMTTNTTKAPEGAATGGTIGGILGGTLGLLAGLGALAIPGMGPFIAAGPIIAALSGSGLGGSLGLLVGSIIGAGIPEYEAKKLEAGVKEGKILIAVTTSDEMADRAYDIMKQGGATDLSKSSATAAKM